MNYTDEEIARAAGFCTTNEGTDFCLDVDAEFQEWRIMPNWPANPGAVATWLLPVLERRYTKISLERHPHIEAYRWIVLYGESASIAPTWHECVIAAIMASAENNNKESENV